jgi:hypothetical protein
MKKLEMSIEERLEKIENWLMFEQGNFYWEMFTVLLRYSAYFFLGYLLVEAMSSALMTVLLETLPEFCSIYGDI